MDDMHIYSELVRRHNEEKQLQTGRQPVCHLHTYGCQQNVSDTEKLRGMLAQMGYTFAGQPGEADLILYNTCAVRENAEERVFGNVGALKLQKRRNPDLIIGLCGCMTQQEHIAQRIRTSYPYVDLVFGTHAIHRLPELLARKLSGTRRVFDVAASDGEIVEGLPVRRDGGIKAWVPIMYGCDNFCTYCVVPFVRGRERSRDPALIHAEVEELVRGGYKEITLLGQNVNSYGKTLEEPRSFARLLRDLNGIAGEFRIRFMTSHPKDCTRELIDAIADCGKIANHIHLPVQSGSDRVLAAMNRGYTAGQYRELIAYARERIPGVTFTSDIIVGFPGETYEDFKQTLELVEQMRYQSLFTFVYSKRKGTKAAAMEDLVPREEKMRWFQELLDTQSAIGRLQYEELVGSVARVLAEGPGRSGEGFLTGRTDTGVIVEFPAPAERVGSYVRVRVAKAMQWAVLGELA